MKKTKTMKQWKLLKDLPGVKAGAIFSNKENGDELLADSYSCVGDNRQWYGFSESQLNQTPDWFERIKEEPVEKMEWKSGQGYYYLNDTGRSDWAICNGHSMDQFRHSVGNFFQSSAKSELYKKKLIALKPKFLPKMGEEYFTPVFDDELYAERNFWGGETFEWWTYYTGITFKTAEECERWKDENYFLYKNPNL